MGSMVIRITVSAGESEGIRRDDAGPGHQKCAEGKAVVAEEVFDKRGRFALEFGKRSDAGKLGAAIAHDLQTMGVEAGAARCR
jgi:hypothetical protein